MYEGRGVAPRQQTSTAGAECSIPCAGAKHGARGEGQGESILLSSLAETSAPSLSGSSPADDGSGEEARHASTSTTRSSSTAGGAAGAAAPVAGRASACAQHSSLHTGHVFWRSSHGTMH